MEWKKVVIWIVILILIALGFFLLSNMTGNTITGNVVGGGAVVESESFRISDFGVGSNGSEINEEVLDGT